MLSSSTSCCPASATLSRGDGRGGPEYPGHWVPLTLSAQTARQFKSKQSNRRWIQSAAYLRLRQTEQLTRQLVALKCPCHQARHFPTMAAHHHSHDSTVQAATAQNMTHVQVSSRHSVFKNSSAHHSTDAFHPPVLRPSLGAIRSVPPKSCVELPLASREQRTRGLVHDTVHVLQRHPSPVQCAFVLPESRRDTTQADKSTYEASA